MQQEYLKYYLGDGAYIHFDGIDVVLTVNNGLETTDAVVLDGPALVKMLNWLEQTKKERSGQSRLYSEF